ncbi:uncharacterized protein AMSG_03050 [Thecamonas trahens ATCC 50062]|uniref:Uncharacterized protein n=1 Tax=Thecamonas trahens ATCC 50062 TaxID=461836 RepID=A0A0L0D2T9_THETB|nr:hypothetical protein AMSG_03050 [Thecamonas trahens ATCC 50062]KNC46614.1 hypothetical protein AMSG_03050 [Thecamonas trahens ATCC 50062]|eukprot:XP_013760387.1 hypothetical protein AMSG_03050 [Thecamonas trahens ATCC 50062]
MASSSSPSTDILGPLQRHLNALAGDNKSATKRALAALSKALLPPPASVSWDEYAVAICTTVAPAVLRVTDAGSERNRENALDLVAALVAPIPPAPAESAAAAPALASDSPQAAMLETLAALALPILVRRYVTPHKTARDAGRAYEPGEPSEEIRATVGSLVVSLVPRLATVGKLAMFVDDVLDVVLALLADPFHDVLLHGAKAVVALCAHARSALKMRISQSVVNAALGLFAHRHSKVRVAGVEALEALLLCKDASISTDLMKDLSPSLATLVLDRAPKVRCAALRMLASWLSLLTDRHVYTRYLIPHMLVGLVDDLPDVNGLARDLIESVATHAAAPEAEELAEITAYGDDPVVDPRLTPEAFAGVRPSLAARRLVGRKMHDMLPQVLADMADWTVKKRFVAVRLIGILMVYGERGMASFVPDIVSAFLAVALDEDPAVLAALHDSAALLGALVDPAPVLNPLLDIIVDAPGTRSAIARAAALTVLASALSGMPQESLAAALAPDGSPLSAALLATLANGPGFDIQSPELHVGLTRVATVLIEHTLDDAAIASSTFLLLKLLLAQLAWAAEPELKAATLAALDALVSRLGAPSLDVLVSAHAQGLLAILLDSVSQWSLVSPRYVLYTHILARLVPASLELALTAAPGGEDEAAAPPLRLLVESAVATADPAVATGIIATLAAALDAAASSDVAPTAAAAPAWLDFLVNLVAPLLVWRAGLPAAELRAAALAVVDAVLRWRALGVTDAIALLAALGAPFPNLVDDRLSSTRKTAVAVASLLFELLAPVDAAVVDDVRALADAVVTRLNDADDSIRASTAPALVALAASGADLGTEYWTTLARSLFIHLDDPSLTIRDAMVAPLTAVAGLLPPETWREVIAAAQASATKAATQLAILDAL